MADHMLTTVDNPYNPFTEWNDWYAWDEAHGYHSSSLLARFTFTSHELSDADQELAVEQAIDEIVEENFFGVHRKVSRPGVQATSGSIGGRGY